MPVTIQTADVEPSRQPLPTSPLETCIRRIVGKDTVFEAVGARAETLHALEFGLLGTLRLAYDRHHPVVLSPDDIWLQILHGYSLHMQDKTQGAPRRRLEVRRDDFILGGDNPWPEVFDAFNTEMRPHIGEALHDVLLPGFSTTGPVERACVGVTVMSAMKNLFRYELLTLCGIPSITLLGTPEDWRALHLHALELCPDDLAFWRPALDRCLTHFIDASEGRVDPAIWRSFFKHVDEGSGNPFLSGWVNALVPLHQSDVHGVCRSGWFADAAQGVDLEQLPAPMADAPVLWKYGPVEIPLRVYAGFVGVQTDAEGRIRPCQGWAVALDDAGDGHHG